MCHYLSINVHPSILANGWDIYIFSSILNSNPNMDLKKCPNLNMDLKILDLTETSTWPDLNLAWYGVGYTEARSENYRGLRLAVHLAQPACVAALKLIHRIASPVNTGVGFWSVKAIVEGEVDWLTVPLKALENV